MSGARRPRVAVIGGGIAGLSTAWLLAGGQRGRPACADVTLYEAGDRLGGHAHTVDVTLDGITHGVDTGFLVWNRRTYPGLVALFDELGVPTAPADMSLSVQTPETEWCGSNLATVFADRRNLLRPHFLGMLADIVRFNRVATALVARIDAGAAAPADTLGEFLDRHRLGTAFRRDYLLPMVACIWSCPVRQMLAYPAATLLRFCHNHGLLQLTDRPQWMTVRGGSRHYVKRMQQALPDVQRGTPVLAVRRLPPGTGQAGVVVQTAGGSQHYDEVVLACHSDQALALLPDATASERRVLGAIGYQPNVAVLHTDTRLLPRRPSAWAAWNHERAPDDEAGMNRVCLHYLINRLQPLPWSRPVIVSLNPVHEPDAGQVLGRYEVAHPVFDTAAIEAQAALPSIQGHHHLWFAGAWTRHGFHEDGLQSGMLVAEALRQRWATAPALAASA